MTQKRLTYLFPILAIGFVAVLALTHTSAEAFIAAQRWSGNSTEYVTSNSLGQAPFPAATLGLINTAAARWSQPSTGIPFWINNFNGQVGPARMVVTRANFATLGFPDVPGANSLFFLSNGRLSFSLLRLNDTWTWNTVCNLNQAQRRVDVMTVTLHEFGHSVRLNHDFRHREAVMWPDFRCKQTLRADDRNGINFLY